MEQYLDRCLNTIINQSYKNLEIILVDDGSTDRSGQICDAYSKKDERIKVIHQENAGLSMARNVGMDVSQGEYIGFVDSDDWVSLDFYEYLYYMIKRYDVDVAMCEYTRDEKKIEEYFTQEDEVIILDKKGIWDYYFRIHGETSCYSVWNRLYKKSAIDNYRFIKGKVNEDLEFGYQINHTIKSLLKAPRRKYMYFKNNASITRDGLKKADLALIEIWDEIVHGMKETEYEYWAKLNRNRATFTLYTKNLLYGHKSDFDTSILKSWKKEIKQNKRQLLQGDFLDWKRKLLLIVECLF